MDKLAGLYTQIQILKKRLNSLDLSKEDPGNVAALSSDLSALEDRYTKISEAKKKRQQEKLSKDAPAVAPEVTVEATPEPEGGYPVDPKWGQDHEVSPWKCSCGTELKTKNQGLAHYRAHHGKDKDLYAADEPTTIAPQPLSIADQMTKPTTEPVQVVESAEELEAKKKKKQCYHCGYYFPVGGSIVSHPCSHAAPGDTCPAASGGGAPAGGAPAGGGMGGGAGAGAGGAGAGAGGGGGAAAAVAAPSQADLQKFSSDDIVEPTKGTPGSWGSVLRHDGGPEDLVYVKWHGGPLKEMHSGYGGYSATDLRKKASAEAPIEKEEDLDVDAKKNIQVVEDFFNGASSGNTKNVKIQKVTLGRALVNYETVIVFDRESDHTYFFNTNKYSVTTSKLQNQIRQHLGGFKVQEVDENGIYAAMKAEDKPRPVKDPNNYLTEHTPSAVDPNNLPVLPKVKAPNKVPLQVATLKLSAVDANPHQTQPLADPVDPAEKGGVGYGGDRPGSAVAPARDGDVTLDAASNCGNCGKPGATEVSKTVKGGHKVFCDGKCMDQFMQKMNRGASLSVESHIKHENGKWVVYNHDYTKQLGHYPSKEEAVTRLRQIEYFKHKGSIKLSTRDVKAEAAPIATEIATQCQQIRDRMKSFQEGLKTQASSGSDEAFKILRIDIEKLRQRYGDYPEAKEALDAIVYEMEQLTKTPGVVPPPAPPVATSAKECADCHGNYEGKEGEKCPTCGQYAVMPKEAAGSNIPPKPTQDPGLNMMWWYNDTTNTWEIKDKLI